MSNARSDKRHSDRVDDVVSNARSDNHQKGVIPLDTGLENVPSPGSQPPDDSSTGLIELPGVSSRDDPARHPSSEENTRSGNYSSQRIDYRSSPIRSFSHESGIPGTRSGRFKLPVYVIHRAVYLFLVPGVVGTTSVIKEVDPNLLLSLIQMNLVQLDIILYQVF